MLGFSTRFHLRATDRPALVGGQPIVIPTFREPSQLGVVAVLPTKSRNIMAAAHYMKVRRPPKLTTDDERTIETSREPLPNNADFQTSILVFPSRAPSVPPSPSAPETQRGSTTVSIPASLIASVEGRSPRSLSPSDSWDETSDSVPQTHLGGALVLQPLTHDRVAQMERSTTWHARAVGRGYASGPDMIDDSDVELWEWTASSPAGSQPISLLQGRRPLSPRRAASVISTHYESASSEFHFSASDQDGSADEQDFESMFLVALKSRRHGDIAPRCTRAVESDHAYGASSFFSPKILSLPFESILHFFFELDPSTINLIKQQNVRPHPDNPCNLPPTNLFPSQVTSDEKLPDDVVDIPGIILRPRSAHSSHSHFADEAHIAIGMVRRGLETQAHAEVIGSDDQPTSSFTRELLIGVTRLPIMLARAVLRI